MQVMAGADLAIALAAEALLLHASDGPYAARLLDEADSISITFHALSDRLSPARLCRIERLQEMQEYHTRLHQLDKIS